MQANIKPPVRAVIIGCGGVGSYLAYPLARLLTHAAPGSELVLVDGDVLEEKNLARQNFSSSQVNQDKADALMQSLMLSGTYDENLLDGVGQYFTPGMEIPGNPEIPTWFFCCVDNHTARKAVLSEVDSNPLYSAILGANEYTDAEAYFYENSFKDSPLDPRVYYPELASIEPDPDDPLRRRMGCNTDSALSETPQLVAANFSAANYMLWLFWFHYFENRFDIAKESWPIRHSNNFAKFKTSTVADLSAAIKLPNLY